MADKNTADFLKAYETALSTLEVEPDNRKAQHGLVLALARLGSLELARKNYEGFGLHTIRHNEDIMALGGRLSKDLYLASSGKIALEHARDSAAKYEAAFKDNGGYYSGVNAATMALAADMPADIVTGRARQVLELLPQRGNLTPEDHYFIEATRAECFLILGESEKVEKALRGAIAFDPLNYPAHASTLKQFRLILDKRSQDQSWLAAFRPPCPLHYAGHIWTDLEQSSESLSLKASDIIQSHDIGFGYGALAAGADIVIAESLLAEGVELNVVLPASVDCFIERSVKPFGQGWVSKFKSCLNRAHSLTVLPDTDLKRNEASMMLASQMAMGQAILRGFNLDVLASQLLIFDPIRTNSLTACHARDWIESGLNQLCLDVNLDVKLEKPDAKKLNTLRVLVKGSMEEGVEKFTSLKSAISKITKESQNDASAYSLVFDLPGANEAIEALSRQNLDGTILVSEAIAGYAVLKHRQDCKVVFAGTVTDKTGASLRSYSLRLL